MKPETRPLLISQQDLSENWNTLRQNYFRFPTETCWSFTLCPSEACGSWFTSQFIPDNIRGKKKEKPMITSPLSHLNNSSHSYVRPPLQKTSSQQTPQCSEIIMQPTVCCLFTWTLDHGSPGSATIYSLRQTEPGSNQAFWAASCHSLSSSSSPIRFPFSRDWYDKTHNCWDIGPENVAQSQRNTPHFHP